MLCPSKHILVYITDESSLVHAEGDPVGGGELEAAGVDNGHSVGLGVGPGRGCQKGQESHGESHRVTHRRRANATCNMESVT